MTSTNPVVEALERALYLLPDTSGYRSTSATWQTADGETLTMTLTWSSSGEEDEEAEPVELVSTCERCGRPWAEHTLGAPGRRRCAS